MSEPAHMQSHVTSFTGLFELELDDDVAIDTVQIPLIQRDYAQGRGGNDVAEIRSGFLDVLHRATTGQAPVGLDFIYGEVTGGTFEPLDGQQRLTTLFLLHWYLAFRTDRLDANDDWTHFSYATRPGARMFCQELVSNPPPAVLEDSPSTWVIDQPWYLHVWGDDPTVQGMLVMIDAIDELFHGDDHEAAWGRLVATDEPAISFHLLPIDDMGSTSELYIKMNSRGKPLTPFETFKARFEEAISWSDRAEKFAHNIDGKWSDLLWPIHGGDYLVDDEFMHYLLFITEICGWRQGDIGEEGRLGPRAAAIFGPDNDQREEHVAFLFDAFDTWIDEERQRADIPGIFSGLLTTESSTHRPEVGDPIVLHSDDEEVNLFKSCCRTYGDRRAFPLSRTLLLYAVLLHRIEGTDDFPRRLRVLRNLIAASDDEVRADRMPELLNDVRAVIVTGAPGGLDDDEHGVSTFNQAQVDDEVRKHAFLTKHPDHAGVIFGLEDHNLLRGSLALFDLTDAAADKIVERAAAFHELFDPDLWRTVAGALHTFGDYHHKRSNTFQFGPPSAWHDRYWRVLFRAYTRYDLGRTHQVVVQLLDSRAAAPNESPRTFLDRVQKEWLADREKATTYDWRYHLVRYDCMRSGATGRYVSSTNELGYMLGMLRTKTPRGRYRDPFLLAIWRESGVGEAIWNDSAWFTGNPRNERWMELSASGTRIQCVKRGFAIQPPPDEHHRAAFRECCEQYDQVANEGEGYLLHISQDNSGIDTEDRVQLGAALLRNLVDAGL